MQKMCINTLLIVFIPFLLNAQVAYKRYKSHGFSEAEQFPELINTDIPGAPVLGKPTLIMGDSKPVMGEGNGWAEPGVIDWNGDEKKDLLIGEFGSGAENGPFAGTLVRVYLNIGTDSVPQFGDDFEYARPGNSNWGDGSPFSVNTWCCMAFKPLFADLDDDGFPDLITGQYHPGEINWFRGSEEGFRPSEKLKQAGDPSSNQDEYYGNNLLPTDSNSFYYWMYSSVAFGDFDEDGDLDMIVGGTGLRISENIGSKKAPKFGPRQLLLDVDGKPLKIHEPPGVDWSKDPAFKHLPSGAFDCVPLVTDWDRDGVLDLLVSNNYATNGLNAINFFRGVKTEAGYRFERAVPLFAAKNGGKAFPGSWLRAFVTDWNNDGVNDLLIGTSVITTDGGRFNHQLSWKWELDKDMMTLKKNPGLFHKRLANDIAKQIKEAEEMERKIGSEAMKGKYLTKDLLVEEYYSKLNNKTIVHKGLVYLMLGSIQKK